MTDRIERTDLSAVIEAVASPAREGMTIDIAASRAALPDEHRAAMKIDAPAGPNRAAIEALRAYHGNPPLPPIVTLDDDSVKRVAAAVVVAMRGEMAF